MKATYVLRLKKWNLLSPITALSLSVAIAVISILLPRTYYERIVGEQNLVFHDLFTALYVAMCVLAFLVGFVLRKILLSPSLKRSRQGRMISNKEPPSLVSTMAISIVLICVNIYTLMVLYNSIPLSLFVSAFLGDVSSLLLRNSVAETLTDQNIGVALNASIALVPWLTFVVLRTSPRVRKTPLGILAVTLIFALLFLVCLNALLVQGRSQLLYPVFAAFVVWCAVRISQDRLTVKRLVSVGLAVFVFAMGYFALIAITRRGLSDGAINPIEQQLVGYFVGSYNRFAAMLDGTFVLPSEGGYYWTQWIWDMPFVSNLLGLQESAASFFGAVGPSVFEDVSPYVYGAGLESDITSLTIFSHTYTDFGWFGFMPFIVYGFVSGLTWVAFRNGSTWAIVLYPYVLWTIVEWRGYIEIARASIIDTFIVLAVAVTVGQLMTRAYVASTMHLRRPRGGGGWTDTKRGSWERARRS
jgi:hypothetical protein